MSAGHTWSVGLVAMEATLVRVEAHISEGISASGGCIDSIGILIKLH